MIEQQRIGARIVKLGSIFLYGTCQAAYGAFGSDRNTIPLHTLTADITWKRVPTPLTWNAACNAIRDHHT